MHTVELFCGTKSFSKAAARFGYDTFTVDIDAQHRPDVVADILTLEAWDLPSAPLFMWASPPCQCFSVMAIRHHWNRDGTPKPQVHEAVAVVAKAVSLIHETRALWWFIENPRGMLRTIKQFEDAVADLGGMRRTITYCQYGDSRMKPTDIWTNAFWWRPREPCFSGAICHEATTGGFVKTGTLRLANAVERSRIPAPLFHDIFKHYDAFERS